MKESTDPRYDRDKRVEAARLYADECLSVRGVADRMGVSPTRAWVFLKDAGVQFRKRKAGQDDR